MEDCRGQFRQLLQPLSNFLFRPWLQPLSDFLGRTGSRLAIIITGANLGLERDPKTERRVNAIAFSGINKRTGFGTAVELTSPMLAMIPLNLF